ncbi:MAG: amidase [Pseudomonadota bacterium]
MNQAPDTAPKSAVEYAGLIRDGSLTSEALVSHCLSVIEQTDGDIRAWAHVDSEGALEQAKAMDNIRLRGQPMGKLHGIPIGIKDLVDTKGLPTAFGCKAFSDRVPENDARIIQRLKEEGAIILGKTTTVEMTAFAPPETRNPWNSDRTPGGSSSGSAAAVASGQVPLAIGTQTIGSVIRPASFCGIYGYKPSRGMISRVGVLETSPNLDQVGMYGLRADDVAMLADVLSGYDAQDSLSYLEPKPLIHRGFHEEVPIEPNFVWIDLPYAGEYSDDVRDAFNDLQDLLGDRIDRVEAPLSFSGLVQAIDIIYKVDFGRCLSAFQPSELDALGDSAQKSLEVAAAISDQDYADAMEAMRATTPWFENFFEEYDAVLTPSALSTAPAFETGTGDPICSAIWTLAGLPCLSLPLMEGEDSLPIGVQLVGAFNDDARFFRTTRWLLEYLENAASVGD